MNDLTSVPLTVAFVEAEVERIRAMASDDEMAHSKEDDLHVAVLQAIAQGRCEDPKRCSEAALKTLEIDFSRWCA